MPKKLNFRCANIYWKGRYNHRTRRIDGLSTLMKYYKVFIYCMVLFEYYGDDLFRIRIFKANAIECNYPKTNVKDFIRNKKNENWRPGELVVGRSTLEF